MTPTIAIAEFRRHLLAGAYGERELLIPSERDYSGMWTALCNHLPEWEARFGFDHPVLFEVRTRINQIADRRPDPVKVFALATARYGREAMLGEEMAA